MAGTGGATEEAGMDTSRIVLEEGLFLFFGVSCKFSTQCLLVQRQRSRFLIGLGDTSRFSKKVVGPSGLQIILHRW